MEFLRSGLKKTWRTMWQHKILFTAAVLLQLLFLFLFAFTAVTTQLEILEDTKNILEPLEQANYNPDAIDAGQPFLSNPSAVIESYQSLKQNISTLFWYIILLYLIINGGLWLLTHAMSNKPTVKQITNQCIKYLVAAILFIIITTTLTTIIFKLFFTTTQHSFTLSMQLTGIAFVIIYYIFLTSFTQLSTTSWKSFYEQTFHLLFKQWKQPLTAFILNTIQLIITIFIMYFLIPYSQKSLLILIIIPIIAAKALVITRAIWISFCTP